MPLVHHGWEDPGNPWWKLAEGDLVATCGHVLHGRFWAMDLQPEPIVVQHDVSGEERAISIGLMCAACFAGETVDFSTIVEWDGRNTSPLGAEA